MRLIDADTLVKDLSYLYTKNHIPVDMKAKEILTTIMEQPTAYDIAKAVSELKTDSSVKLYGSQNSDNYMIPVNRAIEIVKQGGVSDDVCEWKSDYGFISDKYKRETSCGYTFYDLHHAVPFKFCPYCGKKIKIVGD